MRPELLPEVLARDAQELRRALVLTGALAVVPARSRDREWRRAQERYDRLAVRMHLEPISVAVRQIWKPEPGIVDRCPSDDASLQALP